MIVEVKGIGKTYDNGVEALKDVSIGFPQGRDEVDRRLDGTPCGTALGAMAFDALAHFLIGDFRGGDIGRPLFATAGEALGVMALARASAAEHQGDPSHVRTGGKRAMK